MDIGTLTGTIAIEDQLSSALTMMNAKVKQFADNFNTSLGGLAVGVGVAAAGVTAMTAAITALGNRGADINDLSATLDQFSGSADKSAAILEKMRAGTMGVVGDFDLMKSSAKLLAGGVKLTSDQFGTLSQAAFVLQNQGLGPTKDMLEMVNAAMLRGRTRYLEAAIGKIDLAKAEKDYAAKLHTTTNDLTEVEKLESKRAAILEALSKKVKEAGAQQRDFGEMIEYTATQIKNWLDKLASMVAASPNVMRAMNAIGDALNQVFGGSSQNAIDKVVAGINKFADGVTAVVPYIAKFLELIVNTIKFLWDYRDVIVAVTAGWGAYKLAIIAAEIWTKAVAFSITGATAAMGTFLASVLPVTIAVGALAATLTAAYNAYKLWSERGEQAATAMRYQEQEARNLETINKRLGTSFTTMAEAQRYTYRRGLEAAEANKKNAEETAKLKTNTDEAAAATERRGKLAEAAAEKVKELYKAYSGESKELDVVSAALRLLTPAQQRNYDVLSRVVPEIRKLAEANRQLSQSQLEMHESYVGQTLARDADSASKLKENGLTLEMIKQNQTLGITLNDMALFYGVTERAINQYVATLEKELSATRGYASFMAAFYEQQEGERKRREQREKDVNTFIAQMDEEYETRRTAITASETQKRITEIQKEYTAKIVLMSLGKTAEEQIKIREAAYRNMAQAIDEVYLAEEQEAALMAGNGKAASDMLKEVKNGFDEVKNAAKTAALDGLASFFTMLGQISGGNGIGKFLTAVGGISAGLKSANDWANQIGGKSGTAIGGGFGSLSVLFSDGASSAQKFAAGIQSAAVIAQGAKNIWDAAGKSANVMENSMNAALAGAQAGSAFGPWGIAAGAAAGLVAGIVRGKPAWAKAASEVSRDFGVKISEELGKTIADNAKKMFGGSRQASSIFSLSSIISEGGGVNAGNVEKYTAKLRDVFSMLETGAFDSAQAVKVLDENFASLVAGNTDSLGFWSSSLKEIIALNDKFGTQSKAIEDAVRSQVSLMIGSFNAIMAGSAKTRKGWEDIRKEIETNRDAIKKLNEEPERGRGVEWSKKMADAQKNLNDALAKQKAAGAGAGRELQDLGMIAAAAFQGALAKGMSFWEAMDAAGPGIADLRRAYEDLGLEIEDPFMKMLAVQSKVMESNPGLMQSVNGLSGALTSMSNLNMLNADSFAAMGRLAADTYTRIQEEVAKAGGSSSDALLPMQEYLHRAERAAKDLGLPLDENTQRMIDQSKELGIWKEQGPTAAEAMQKATENLTTAIENLTLAMRGIPTSLPDPFAGWNTPGSGSPGFDSGGVVGRDWKQRSSRDVIPAWLRRGEIVVEPEDMIAPPSVARSGESNSTQNSGPLVVQLNLDGKKLTDVVIDRMGPRLSMRGGIR